MEKVQHNVTLELPTDREAISWLANLVEQANIPASQASNILAIKIWLGTLENRLEDHQGKALPDAAAANNPEFARKAGVSQSVAREFHNADKSRARVRALRSRR